MYFISYTDEHATGSQKGRLKTIKAMNTSAMISAWRTQASWQPPSCNHQELHRPTTLCRGHAPSGRRHRSKVQASNSGGPDDFVTRIVGRLFGKAALDAEEPGLLISFANVVMQKQCCTPGCGSLALNAPCLARPAQAHPAGLQYSLICLCRRHEAAAGASAVGAVPCSPGRVCQPYGER